MVGGFIADPPYLSAHMSVCAQMSTADKGQRDGEASRG